jgi:hypothetical protein
VKYQARVSNMKLNANKTGRHLAKNSAPTTPPKPSTIAPTGTRQHKEAATAEVTLPTNANT